MENDVLRVDAGLQLPVDLDAPHLQLVQRDRLGGQHIAHLAGADAKGDGPEGAVGRGMGIPAGDGRARLGDALLGAHDVHDPLLARVCIKKCNTVLGAVAAELFDHPLGQRIAVGLDRLVRRHDVVDGGEGAGGKTHRQPAVPQHAKGLGAGHLMDQMCTDEQLRLPVAELAHGMRRPHFFK